MLIKMKLYRINQDNISNAKYRNNHTFQDWIDILISSRHFLYEKFDRKINHYKKYNINKKKYLK